ncbi:ATP-dependent helicase [Candidatus Woesearchaeota archaeon]|nr:MAG: ATP-dependent helicase [Candidatus Woesearchaeota archaeon]
MAVVFQEKPYKDEEILNILHPVIKEWFTGKFKEFAPPQKFSIINIHQRENTLISSPTGSGKTLSAFLSILNELIDLSQKKILEDRVYCIYISPLKALANDIERNLKQPLQEMEEIAKQQNKEFKVNVALRTGDTTASEKAKMLKQVPHILITTPESFAIMLSTTKFKENIKQVEWVIIDEIHSLAESKRGVHLSLSMERLNAITNFTRIGLSATISPLEDVGKFLVGMKDETEPRDCKIVDVQYLKKLDLQVLSPVSNLINATHEVVHTEMYKLLDKLIQEHRTTLIFTNTRSATERVVHHLKDKFPQNYVKFNEEAEGEKSFIGAHHGSLSREHRLDIETKLKQGKLKAVVSSTSLELGIDIGYIDLVILLSSPKSVARALQRIGRSGHKLHDLAKGRLIVMDRDDLVECAVLLKAAIEKKIDKIHIPENAIDVLAQQIFGMVIEEPKNIEETFFLVKRSYCFRNLARSSYQDILRYLSGEYVSLEERNVYAKIWIDETTGMMGKKGKMARMLYMTNIGTIPDETSVKVKVKDVIIGRIDENFLERLKRGDIFVLGGNVYEFLYSQGMTAFVKASVSRPPTVPSWFSEQLPLSFDLAMEIQKFRRYMEEFFDSKTPRAEVLKFIHDYLYIDEYGANSIYEYFKEQHAYSEIPHDRKIVIEYYNDGNNKYIIFHTLFGRRVNDVLSRAMAFAIAKVQKKDVEMNINDNGFYILTKENIQAARIFKMLKSKDLRKLMELALDKTVVLNRRFRHCASRALMILRNYMGRKKSVSRQAQNSRLLLSAVKKISNEFPILQESRREVLEDLMDIGNAELVLKEVEDEKISIKEIYTDVPTPFAFNLVTMGYSDIMKMDDKLEFLRRMHQMVLAKISLDQTKKEQAYLNMQELIQENYKKAQQEKDPEKEKLKAMAWNLEKVPMFAKEEIVKVIENDSAFSEEMKAQIQKHIAEIKKSWPEELLEFILERL